jgi:hypothetical protein
MPSDAISSQVMLMYSSVFSSRLPIMLAAEPKPRTASPVSTVVP